MINILKNVLLFKGLKEDQLSKILENLEPRNYEKGETIFEEGSPGDTLYIIEKGKVEVRLKRGDLVLVLAELENGSFFGELSLISDVPRSATCIAVKESSLYVLKREDFWKIVERDPKIGVLVLKNLAIELAERIRETNKNLETYFLINQAIIDNEQFRKLYIAAKGRSI
ncbi:MAG: cyclic nucleotide-binding domain-containing protein [Candidatus Hydrothermales bacterium]